MSRKTRKAARDRQQGGKVPVKIVRRPKPKPVPPYEAPK